MSLQLSRDLLRQIHAHGESAYPEEGAGLLLGSANGQGREVRAILPFDNAREDDARRTRYLIKAEDMLRGEKEAARQNLDVIGVFHSHPDRPDRPSEFDREWALPWYSYVITRVAQGAAESSRCWRLTDDRTIFEEEEMVIGE